MNNAENIGWTTKPISETAGLDKEVQGHIWEVACIAESTLNAYEWMTKLQIEVNWETKEIYLDNENLRVDSSNWEVKKIRWHNVKVNTEWDIKEYIYWPDAWQQLFNNRKSAQREANKLWKRVPSPQEFKAIIDKIWVEEFLKVFHGYNTDYGFWKREINAFYWCSSELENILDMGLFMVNSKESRYLHGRSMDLSVRLVRD